MNKISTLFGFCIVSFVLACNTVIDLRSTKMDGEDGGSAGNGTTTTSSDTTTTTSTSSSTTSEGGAGGTVDVGGSGGAGGLSPVATISLEGNPVSGVFVKKQQNVPVLGITITAGDEDITVSSLTLTTQVAVANSGCDFGEQCAREAAWQRFTSLSLWSGVQLGGAVAPDSTTGMAQITGVNVVIPAHDAVTFTVVAGFSSKTSADPYDRVAVGVANAWDVVILNGQQESVLGSIDMKLQDQLGAAPTVQHTILNAGELTVIADNHPPTTNIIAGKDVWVPFASYKACAQYEAVSFDYARIYQGSAMGDDSDFTQIAVASGGMVHGTGILPAGATGAEDVYLSDGVITAPKDGCVNFQLWGKTAAVFPTISVGGQTGYPRSGHQPALGIADSETTGEWTPEYTGNLNLRSTGVTSSERVYAASGAPMGNPMVLRKSKPFFAKQPLSSTTLTNGDMDLIKFQVAADSAGPVAIKSFFFGCGPGLNVNVSDIRLRRGASEMPIVSYSVLGGDKKYDGLPPYCMFQIRFTDEEIVSGPGYVYTVHAMISGAAGGVSLWFGTSAVKYPLGVNPFVPTGSLSEYMQVGLGGFMSIADAYTAEIARPGLTWSDMSEAQAHNSFIGGSADWTSDIYVDGWDMDQTLSL